jgi:rhamnose utilization protein RhaD (predicted bifunctional aldolase and dehydrogenase)
MLHALGIALCGAAYVGHTHPTAVNALLCSDRAEELVAGHLFPDQVVVCGRHALFVGYAEPGLALGRAVRDGLRAHLDRHGTPPKLIYLGNHGIVALGASAEEVHQVTAMSVKAARVLSGALAVGRPAYLPAASVDALDARPDEQHRRRVLAGGASLRQSGTQA